MVDNLRDESLIVLSLRRFSELDYSLSSKIATMLPYDGLLRKFFQIFTLTGTAIAWLLILPVIFFVLPFWQPQVYTLFMVNGLMSLVVLVIKQIVKRNRPSFKDDRFLSVAFDVFSFPSGHAARSIYVAILMTIYMPHLAYMWYLWGVLIIISRMVLGVHYLSDIFAGIVVGAVSMVTFYFLGFIPVFPFSQFVM